MKKFVHETDEDFSRLLKLEIEFSRDDEEFRSMRKNIIHWNK